MHHTQSNLNSLDWRLRKSQRYFNRIGLGVYDFLVYRIVSKFLWGIGPGTLIERYKKLVGPHHLEVGVGTGYLLEQSVVDCEKLVLLDLSGSCLEKAKKRLFRLDPIMVQHNLLQPCDAKFEGPFQSIAVNYVMHCIPGDYREKQIVFANLAPLLSRNGVIFGATVLANENSSLLARYFMLVLNKIGLFNNRKDTVQGLYQALFSNFKYVRLTERSASVLFVAANDEAAFLEACDEVND